MLKERKSGMTMSSRERVLLSLDHKEPDRLPIEPPNLVNIEGPAKHLIDTFDFDRKVSLDFRKNLDEKYELPDNMFVDVYGCRWKYKGVGMPYCVYSPLAFARKAKDIEKYEKWPDPNDPLLIMKDARRKAKQLYEETECVTQIFGGQMFHRYAWLRGFAKWLIDMKTNPELYKAIAERLYHINSTSTMRLLQEVGDYTHVVVASDDMGASTTPFMSAEDFRQFVKPFYKALIDGIKREFPRLKFFLHSHGCIMKFIPDIIDCGVDILNPVLPGDNMDPVRLKKEFGRQLTFDGGVDIEYILPFKTPNVVREHVRKVIDILAPGGGYIFRLQMISHVVPYQNLYAAYETAREYGEYGK